MALSPFAAIGIVEGLAAIPSLISNISAASTTSASPVVSTMVRQGAHRLILRAPAGGIQIGSRFFAGGTFLPSSGAIVTDSMFFQLYGLSSSGAATALTPLVSETISSIPVLIKWAISISGSAAVVNYIKKQDGTSGGTVVEANSNPSKK